MTVDYFPENAGLQNVHNLVISVFMAERADPPKKNGVLIKM